MSRNNIDQAKAYHLSQEYGTKFGPMNLAVAGTTLTLGVDAPTMVVLDPAQALTVTLPAPTRGLFFWIAHKSTGNFDITVSSPVDRTGAAGATTFLTVSQNETGYVFSDGVTWYAGVGKAT